MDALDLDFESYAALLTDLAKVNRLLLSARPTLAFLARAMGGRRRFRLLDVGFGHGDMLRSISRWARAREIDAELIGIDLNPRSEIVAKAATPAGTGISFQTGDYAGLAGEGFDFVISNFVAHHMADDQLIAFLRFMEAEARIGWLVNDIRRSAFAHATYPWLARAMRWHRIVREDGTLSIARGWREAEWPPYLAAAGGHAATARIVRRFPFRLCVERTR
ncbi:methyltransferase domain-containing protein [Sphingomonas sp.]|uniref:methyltransferase domain-containing protein n=1 Tax=Sphingomonas sp. TaxID=28214 RepID=UPI000DB0ABA8|nr:methyltransferase domain-containing protein [Sphingomonas sp.]PZU12025.1 MAG: methyltransferase type 12 [Sphingomonas sp.]